MQFFNTLLNPALFAALAAASPIEGRAGLVSLNLYSDGNCANKIQTIVLQNHTCMAASGAFSSAKVAANAQIAIAEAFTQPGCSPGITKGFITNNATLCVGSFQSGPAKYIEGFYPNKSS